MTNIVAAFAAAIRPITHLVRAEVLLRNYEKLDGASKLIWGTSTLTAAAAESCVSQLIKNLGTLIQGYDAVQDNMGIIINKATLELIAYSSDCFFTIVPFITILENGETVTTTSGTETDPKTAIDDSITGTYMVSIGDPRVSTILWDNGSAKYRCKFDLDITNYVKEYTRSIQTKALQEESLPELIFGTFAVMSAAQKAVTVNSCIHLSYSFKEQNKIFV